jgi:O-antigen/teichoic acid export membrane protein
MAEEKQVLKNTLVFSVLKYIAFFVMVITGFVITKYLGPASFGVYSAMILILSYGRYAFMAFYSGFYKKASFFKGRKEFNKVEDVRQATFSASFYIILAIGISLFIVSFFIEYDSEVLSALRAVSVLLVLQQVYYFYGIFLRVDKKFSMYGALELAFQVLRLLMILVFIWRFGVVGVLLSSILAYSLVLGIGYSKKPYRFSFRVPFRRSKEMFFFGLPNTILGAFGTVFITVDKLMIINFFNRSLLGIYSFVVLVLEVITYIPVNIAIIILPSQLERQGAKFEKQRIKNMFMIPITIVSYLLPVIISAAFFFSDPVIRYVFPKYMDALPPLRILIFGGFFLSSINILENYVISVNQERKIIVVKIMIIVVSVFLNYLAISNGYGLLGVAAATTVTYLVYFVYLLAFSLKNFSRVLKKNLSEFFILVFPLLYMILMIYLIQMISPDYDGIFLGFGIAVAKYLLFLVLSIPLWLYIEKKTGIFRLAIQEFLRIIKHSSKR